MTRKRIGVLLSAILVAGVLSSMVWGGFRSRTRLDEFLSRRKAVLTGLAQGVRNLPPGAEHAMPHVSSTIDPLFPGDNHIQSVVRSTAWTTRGFRNIPLNLSDKFLEGRSGIDVAHELVRHFVRDFGKIGMKPMPSDRPNIEWQKVYAVASQIWHDPQQELTVIVQADYFVDAKKAHITCYVIERFDP